MTLGTRKGIQLRIAQAVAALVLVVALWPQQAAAWWNDEWSMRKKIVFDTGASGAAVSDAIGTTPMLVRLHVGNFRFGSAKEDGGDLRFVAGDDKTPLKHHVEKYDSLIGEALIWVAVPDLKPGTKNEIWLYYGNAKVPAAVDAKNTYDPNTLLVYHFAERGTPPQDISAWGNSATTPVAAADGAIIGQGARFDGQSALTIPAGPPLATAEGGEMTWSLWLKSAAPQPRAVLYARRDGANALIIGLDNGVPFVEVTAAGATQRGVGGAAIPAATWHHLAVTAKAGQIVIYVDGAQAGTLAAALPALTGIASVGKDAAAAAPAPDAAAAPVAADAAAAPAAAGDAAAAPAATPDAAAAPTVPADAAVAPDAAGAAPLIGFVGDIDEFQIAKVARPAGFIKVAAIGQGPDQAKLTTFSVDEETASWLSGYFAVILKSVTLDGWIVIGILAIMMVISWVVMVDRVSYLNRVTKGNTVFLKHFREAANDLEGVLQLDSEESDPSLGGGVDVKHHKIIHASPLYRLMHLGAQQIRLRFSGNGGARALSPQAIQSIRAVLDSGLIHEAQRLNKMMVMLTIAISGGPFLGLLGTVVGVMITFAAIAASGDVNVNAIAPGIAAALVATVAGLAVAIPALFGYNYLTIRIKDATNDMHVFVDELVTKMAESYHQQPGAPRRQAAE
ncbi:outer membrane transport energization protein ExbB [Rhodopseudomonas thermotolerans]|uniref:Outer membrane transport energization protein ExbB n=2 Tax=Rhodopseudomonas TaxID=1073 RepID=A0A336JMJ7_9BRAD|nr:MULTISPECIES: MotA/TolQ/ExbB proton channel family protein [Rhodopseudomonas]RED35200.1 outer membrane transport energization protein ExbB [Rhodopseudomonas pentothenatexigens]REG03043.1 outer membrane transport energization protein ExbB [Rhodopseudomonas thermotolerans]SSW90890.1 outer membrane transport energization protein ExbB [Rhodopseudomonas pentothenatexigens]